MAGEGWWQRRAAGDLVTPEEAAAGEPAQEPVTDVLPRPSEPAVAALPQAPGPTVDVLDAGHPTTQLDPLVAGASADPGAMTQVIDRSAGAGATPPGVPGAGGPGAPLLSRRAAAELGIYVGAGLVVLAAGGVALRAWGDWDLALRAAAVALTSVALLATGLFVRLPWRRRPGPERRRAVSALLTGGMGLVLTATALGLDIRQGGGGPAVLHAMAAVLAMLLVAAVARTPLSETGVLLSATWAAWLLVPSTPWTWLVIAGLGLAWAAAGSRLARGRRTAVVAGAALALAGAVGLGQGAMAWGVRGVLGGVTLFGLLAFLRGRSNGWLALGAAAATALAASVAGGQLGPAPALLVGGLATMAVSAIALRSARRAG